MKKEYYVEMERCERLMAQAHAAEAKAWEYEGRTEMAERYLGFAERAESRADSYKRMIEMVGVTE